MMTGIFIAIGVKSTVVLAAAALVNGLMSRRGSAASRHFVWSLAVTSLVLLPIVSVATPGWRVAIHVTAPDPHPGSSRALTPEPAAPSVRSAGVPPGLSPTAVTPQESLFSTVARLVTIALLATLGTLATTMIPTLYVIGVLFLLGRVAVEQWSVRRLADRAVDVNDPEWTGLLTECARLIGMQRPVRLARSHEHVIPMTLGTLAPTILIPTVADEWPEDRRRAVLLHELAHIDRHDCFVQILAAVASAFYFVHPGIWWAARRLRVERELACDDRVLAAGTRPAEYAGHLLELAYACGGHRAPALLVPMAHPRQLEGRLRSALDSARSRTAPGRRARGAALVLTAAALVPLATVEITSAPSAPARARAGAQAAADATATFAGTWSIRLSPTPGAVRLQLRELNRSHESTVPLDEFEGLTSEALSGGRGAAQFRLRRDAGTFVFEGLVQSGVGAGTYTFVPGERFSADLAARGFARPTPAQSYALARSDLGLAFVDELTEQGYPRPDLAQLVLAARHGASVHDLRERGQLGYRLGSIDALVEQLDHGVSPAFIRELRAQGLKGLSADDLIRARDHGISPKYIAELGALGYPALSLEALVRARDHGISPEYARDLRQLGYQLAPGDLERARGHGISPDYVRDLRRLGYQLTLEDLIRARDHGVGPEYAADLRALGYADLSLEDLIRARDHGVSPDYIRQLDALGYQRASLGEIFRLRDHGVTADYVQRLQRLGYAHLTVDDLVRLRDQGVPHDSFQRAIDRLRSLTLLDIYRAFKAFADHASG